MANFMKLTFIDEERTPLFVNLDQISYFQKVGDDTAIYFAAGKAETFLATRVREEPEIIFSRISHRTA